MTFPHGDGTGIILDGSEINVTYIVRAKLFTDSCQDGLQFSYRLQFGPELQLAALTSVLSYADALTTISPLAPSASGSQFPSTMTFTDITTLPQGHTFDHMDVSVQDDGGGSFTKSISNPKGEVVFNNGDGGLILDGTLNNPVYQVSARLFTNLSPKGVLFGYTISYT